MSFRPQRPQPKKKLIENRINSQITSPTVRLISSTLYEVEGGSKVMTVQEAMRLRSSLGTDLIEISYNPKDGCSVCKLLDKDKFAYQQKRKEKELKQSQKSTELKEVKLGVDIAQNDFDTKLRQARKFLEKGENVKVSLMLKGRSKYMDFSKKRAEEVVLTFADKLTDIGKIISMPKWAGNRIFLQVNKK